ncbi:MAG: DDE-type integrase/transposase/recombinase [Candidatus Altiarchaeota archaeon]|nr:DDE-type integrase/transposase/recombinase [Candidatus Altiarchaeota archaeon]
MKIKAKPQPSKRFQRRHVDSLWQGDTFQFRIRGVGKVYVTGFTDDCSRYRMVSKVYLHKIRKEAINALQWALRKGRMPKQIYLDNGKQFIAKDFKTEAQKHGIKLVYGKPYNPKGRGKIEAYHKVLYRELISQKKLHITIPLQERTSHVRQEIQLLEKTSDTWLADASKHL